MTMLRIALVNVPFANVQMPSIALTQLKSILDAKFGDRISVELIYLNHDFAHEMGVNLYTYIANSTDALNSGLGDWFFRQSAFPDLEDNTEKYFKRYYPFRTKQFDTFKDNILAKRRELDKVLDALIAKHALEKRDIVGFTSMFMQNVASFAVARKLKELNPNIITLMGGANCETPMGQVIAKSVDRIDYVFSGPGLKSLPKFIQHCLDGEREKCDTIKGVFSAKNVSLRPLSDSIGDELDINAEVKMDYDPFLDSFQRTFSKTQIKPVLLFETSRGCWWGERAHCTFCGLNGITMNYRSMTPQRALEQFSSLFKYYPQVTSFEAVDNILPKSYLSEVLPFIAPPQGVDLFYEVKADLSIEDVQTLVKARVTRIQPGIESLATSTLKLMKKGTSVFQNLDLLKNCVRYKIEPAWNLLIGFPGEGEEVYQKYIEDLPSLVHLPPPSGVFPVRYDRYSPYFVKAKDYDLDLKPLDFYRLIYPFPQAALENLAYYFSDVNFEAEYFVLALRWINKIKEKVNPWIARWQQPKEPPKLHFKDNQTKRKIYDSRSDKVIEHEISGAGSRILELTDRPKHLGDLARIFSGDPNINLTEEIRILQEKRFLFNETDRFLNLVLPFEQKMN